MATITHVLFFMIWKKSNCVAGLACPASVKILTAFSELEDIEDILSFIYSIFCFAPVVASFVFVTVDSFDL